MDDLRKLEEDLARLEFAPPPRWLRARVMVAASNSIAVAARRRRRRAVFIVAVAAALLIALAGRYVATALGLFGSQEPGPYQAGPLQPGLPPSEVVEGALRAVRDRALADPAPAPADEPAPPEGHTPAGGAPEEQ